MAMEVYQGNAVFTSEQEQALDAPLDATLIKQRPDGKKYLKGSTEFDNANRIFGYGRWGYKIISNALEKVYNPMQDDKVVGVRYVAQIELYVAGALFPMYGDGGQVVTDYTPQGFENASKGATTDAVKRALRHYGDQFGLCLYDEDSLVDVGDGVLTRVKEVKVNNNQSGQKRIVDGNKASQPRITAPVQSQQPTTTPKPEDALRALMVRVYDRALALGEFHKGINNDVTLENFLKFATEVLDIKVTAAGHLTMSRLEAIDKYLDSKDQA